MSREVVIDPSVTAPWLFPDEESANSRRLFAAVLTAEVSVVVPELWHYELINALRTAVRRGRLKEHEAAGAALRLEGLSVESVPAADQGHGTILSAALEYGLTGYDASFFALARARGVQLVTGDDHLLRLRERFPWIVSLEDFCAQLDEA